LEKFTNSIINYTTTFILKVPKLILDFFILLFVIFYALKDGKPAVDKMFKAVPLKEHNKEHLRNKMSKVTAALLYGIIVVGILQGLVAMIGLYIFNVPSPLLWGLVMIILSILPFVGAWMVWLPAALFKIFGGDFSNGFGLVIFGTLIVGTIDNIIRPKLVGVRAKIHPLTVLLGVVGGIMFFGFMGVILGPLILELCLTFLSIYREK
jgi:predicted PurR-regulated permease PerM